MTTHETHATHEKHDAHEKAAKKPPGSELPPGATFCDCTVPPHVDNCPDCWGFGMIRVYQEKHLAYRPRRASEATGGVTQHAGPCPTCGTAVEIEGYGPAQLKATAEPKPA